MADRRSFNEMVCNVGEVDIDTALVKRFKCLCDPAMKPGSLGAGYGVTKCFPNELMNETITPAGSVYPLQNSCEFAFREQVQ